MSSRRSTSSAIASMYDRMSRERAFTANDHRPRDRAYYEELATDARRRLRTEVGNRRAMDRAEADLGIALARLAELNGTR